MKISVFEENFIAAVEYLYETRNAERYYKFKSKPEISSFIQYRILETIKYGSVYSSTAGLLILCSYGEENEDTVLVDIYVDSRREYRIKSKYKDMDVDEVEFEFIKDDDN